MLPYCTRLMEGQRLARVAPLISESCGPSEKCVPFSQKLGVRPHPRRMGDEDSTALEALQPVLQHRAISLSENVKSHLHGEVGADAQDMAVKGGVMEFAEGQTVWDDRFSLGVPIREDVSSLQQFLMPQAADRALDLVCAEDTLPKALLMEAALGDGRHVLAAALDAYFH